MMTTATTANNRPAAEPLRGDLADGHRAGELLLRHHAEVQRIEREIQRDGDGRANHQGARDVFDRLADLFGDVHRGVPSRVAEHHGHQRQ
jgi:hypothetical protein